MKERKSELLRVGEGGRCEVKDKAMRRLDGPASGARSEREPWACVRSHPALMLLLLLLACPRPFAC